jgi:hypothetical protein
MKQDILAEAEYMPLEVSQSIYVWSPGGRKPAADRSRTCVISAHGVESLVKSSSPVPKDVVLVYYCPHGHTLDQTDVGAVATGSVPFFEIVPKGRGGQDYKLTKYQGSHSQAGETYGYIQHGMHRAGKAESARSRFALKPTDVAQFKKRGIGVLNKLADDLGASLAKIGASRAPFRDVVTIRNRSWFKSELTLFEVIDKLEKAGFHYGEVHGAHCRAFADRESFGWAAPKRNAA